MQQKAELKPAFQLLHSFQGWQKIVTLGSSQHKLEAKMDSAAWWGKKQTNWANNKRNVEVSITITFLFSLDHQVAQVTPGSS